MPELPEVETTRRLIAPLLVGRTVREVHTTTPSYFFLTPPATLRRELRGATFCDLSRHGKYLVASLADGRRLLLHLGMTGQLFSSSAHSPRLLRKTGTGTKTPAEQRTFSPDEHTHLALGFSDGGERVFFRDVRKFGKVRLIPLGETDPRLAKLGPDALLADGAALAEVGRRRSAAVKALLLDQSTLAGVGNIYADEALFLAGVRPSRPSNRVRAAEWQAIAHGVRHVLTRGIATGGASISDFVRPDGKDGGFQDERNVYGRAGEPCPRCGTPLAHATIATRSTTFCRRCQR